MSTPHQPEMRVQRLRRGNAAGLHLVRTTRAEAAQAAIADQLDGATWLECRDCYADFRFDESPSAERCAMCESWHEWWAGAQTVAGGPQ